MSQTSKSQHPLIVKLSARQTELGLTDTEFARRLEISRPLWWMTRNETRRVNIMLLSGIAKAFPELDEEILAALRRWRAV